ncbi:MAG: hypothetical protein A3C07_03995 [Candidatus Sungbacteria bacterium RIFCSPHIGHO2_02_FULL_47_11]|uniref:Uncharacterized protein n=1 Tax=Candidatus Sungbacteria bacterium RIFCSPHIGHO2_02_FULL_47_11 TaxID=1802270 RepID=A0A1G2KJM0_9BACT|nr:MAG: hypothetical protein A3C07_03995 [Candidatus Sungbacteria bacterium RIFCSPHIGHO2_02_FULL_47_11]
MVSAFVFKKTLQFLCEITSGENLRENSIVKEFVATALFKPREVEKKTESGPIRRTYYETVTPHDKNYFWAVVDVLRQKSFSVYVFDGTRVAVARLILAAPIAAEERIEFLQLLLSVPEEQVESLKINIESDFNNLLIKLDEVV